MKKNETSSVKKLPVILLVILLVSAAVIVFFIINKYRKGKKSLTSGKVTKERVNTGKWQEGVIEYDGKYYKYNTNIKTFLFLGIDKSGEAVTSTSGAEGGQSDVIFLIVENRETKKMSMIAINRNSMTDIDVYDVHDNYVDTINAQICLQHTYGDGGKISCMRTETAVSALMDDIPISGYYSMNLDGIPILNDALGGVEVNVMDDIDAFGVKLHKGDDVTLNGKQAYAYIRSRDVNQFNSASERLERQKQYIESMTKKIRSLNTLGADGMLDLYNNLKDYSVTDLDMSSLVNELQDYEFSGDMYTVPGQMVQGDPYEEFNIDEDGLKKMIIDIFYVETEAPENK